MYRYGVAMIVSSVLLNPLSGRLDANSPLLQTDKWRILVDKVVSYGSRPHMTAAQVQEMTQAGFKVIVPRWAGDNLELVKQGATLTEKHAARCRPSFRG